MVESRPGAQGDLFGTTPRATIADSFARIFGLYFHQDIDCAFELIRPAAMRILALILFAAIFGAAIHWWQVAPALAAVYGAASAACFAMYAVDKAAAKAGRWRTSENVLLLMGLACGWPGAVVAQQVLRHKSHKRSFAARFWITVVLNSTLFIYLVSPVSPLRPT
jgi:uncharacterized membrane protein YsdA (DUF1294 family)